MINRRGLLGLLGATATATLFVPRRAPAEEARSVTRIGLQLYTVRKLLEKDVPGTLAAVAAAGYTEVETAGYAGLPPAEFAAALAQAGLRAPSAHFRLADFDSLGARIFDLARTLGHRFLVVPVPEVRLGARLDDYRRLADRLNEYGGQCRAAGMQIAYHNHDFEFAAIDGVRPFDLLLDRCDRALVKFELDLYWAAKAGADPAALLGAAPERFPLCHVKDMMRDGAMATVGEGTIDFGALFRVGTGLQHHFVEHDAPADPLDCIRRGAAALKAVRF